MALHCVETIVSANKRTTLEKDEQEAARELLPGIPDEISVNVLAAKFLRWRDICILSSVSRGWRQVVRSREVYNARVRSQSTEKLFLNCRIHFSLVASTAEVTLRPTAGNYCHRLPLIPGFCRMPILASQLAPLDGKIYLLGGQITFERGNDNSRQSSNNVYVLDFAGQRQWKPCASMNRGRAGFGSAVLDGKIYVFGGYQNISLNIGQRIDAPVRESEVYDPQKDTWTRIKAIPNLRFCHHVLQAGPFLVMHGGYIFRPEESGRSGSKYLITEATSMEVYHPGEDNWRVLSNGVLPQGKTTTMGDPMTFFDYLGGNGDHVGPRPYLSV